MYHLRAAKALSGDTAHREQSPPLCNVVLWPTRASDPTTVLAQRGVDYDYSTYRFFGALVGRVGVRIQLELVEQLQRRLLHIVVEVQLRARQSAQCLPSRSRPWPRLACRSSWCSSSIGGSCVAWIGMGPLGTTKKCTEHTLSGKYQPIPCCLLLQPVLCEASSGVAWRVETSQLILKVARSGRTTTLSSNSPQPCSSISNGCCSTSRTGLWNVGCKKNTACGRDLGVNVR